MKTKFVCLSDAAQTAIDGGFTCDPNAKWTQIQKNTRVGAELVTALDEAARAFLQRMARRIYGRQAKVWGPRVDGPCTDGRIYEATIGDGHQFEKVWFAVIERL